MSEASRKTMTWCKWGMSLCVLLIGVGVANMLTDDPVWSIGLGATSVLGVPVAGVALWRAAVWFRRVGRQEQ